MFKLVSEMSQNFYSPYTTHRVLQYQDGDWNVAEGDGQQVQAAQHHAQEYDDGAGGSGMQTEGAYFGQAAEHLKPISGAHVGVGEKPVDMLELKNNHEGSCLLVLKNCK